MTEEFKLETAVRDVVPNDLPFIFTTWLQHYYASSRYTRRIPRRIYFAEYHKIVEAILARSAVLVATPADEPEIILGYAAFERRSPPVVHWVYVKNRMRRTGIARQLLEGVDLNKCVFTHWTHELDVQLEPKSRETLIAKWPGAVFNPYAAFQQGVRK